MKKFMTLITLVLTLSMFATTNAFAATLDQDTPSGDSTVYYKIGEITNPNNPDDPTDDVIGGTYTVSIPDFVEAADVGKTPITQNVTASKVMIPYNTNLTVAVNYDNVLKLKDSNTVTVDYALQADGTAVNSGDVVLTSPAGNPNAVTETAIGAILLNKPVYSGVYENTATFTVSVA